MVKYCKFNGRRVYIGVKMIGLIFALRHRCLTWKFQVTLFTKFVNLLLFVFGNSWFFLFIICYLRLILKWPTISIWSRRNCTALIFALPYGCLYIPCNSPANCGPFKGFVSKSERFSADGTYWIWIIPASTYPFTKW